MNQLTIKQYWTATTVYVTVLVVLSVILSDFMGKGTELHDVFYAFFTLIGVTIVPIAVIFYGTWRKKMDDILENNKIIADRLSETDAQNKAVLKSNQRVIKLVESLIERMDKQEEGEVT